MDKRLNTLETWINTETTIKVDKIEPASADASFRRYFRAHLATANNSTRTPGDPPQTIIAMDAPPEHEDNQRFINCAEVFKQCGLHAPEIIQYDLVQGFLLLEDLGNCTYQDQLNADSADGLYTDATAALIKLQRQSSQFATQFSAYDEQLLQQEMNLFTQWYVEKHLDKKLGKAQLKALQSTFKLLINNAIQQPQVLVHRDYHCRNLLVTADANPGIIDFQDMVIGPISYDLASLYKDCYIAWPREQVEHWVEQYRQQAIAQQLLSSTINPAQWLQWFDLMGAQRHLKVLGIFARLNHRDNKAQYLDDLPLVNHYLQDTCSRYQALQPLGQLLDELHSNPSNS